MTVQAMAHGIEHWALERLIPYARNPRTHSGAQVRADRSQHRRVRFQQPNSRGHESRHPRGAWPLLAARKLQLKEVPVIILDHLTEAQKRAYILADNQLALDAGWDESLLRIEPAALQEEEFSLNVICSEELVSTSMRHAWLCADRQSRRKPSWNSLPISAHIGPHHAERNRCFHGSRNAGIERRGSVN
jgi:hypothetical protein